MSFLRPKRKQSALAGNRGDCKNGILPNARNSRYRTVNAPKFRFAPTGIRHNLRTTPHPKNNVDFLAEPPKFKDAEVVKNQH